jgi:putative oxidoreductase
MSNSITLLARILLAAIFLISGVRKVMAFPIVAGMMAGKGFPFAEVFLVATIVLEIVGGIMLIANWNAKYAAWALAAFTLAAGAIFHGFWHVWNAPPPQFNNEFNHFLKNVAIVGGLLLVAALADRDADRRA